MRDFNFEGANTSAADIAGPRPVVVEDVLQPIMVDESIEESPFSAEAINQESLGEDTSGMRPFHAGQDDDEESGNLPKYLGAAAVVAILAVGGGIYAYEFSTANQAPKPIAMKTAAPTNVASNQPVAPTPPAALPENNAPITPAPAPVKSVNATPVPATAAPEQQASAKPLTPGIGIGPTDDPAIDAPMTFTADSAPSPQQAGASEVAQATPATPAEQTAANPAPADQTAAMQQPVTAPNVGTNTQPTASVAQLPKHMLQPSIQPAP